ncbi:MAG: HlyD family efflux transporter periplasmic adaptor subunit [bacterium]|nr:HlyD family efflux transporter periplasmic adaptor subunit [bacterium]
MPKRAVVIVVLLLAAVAAVAWLRRDGGPHRYTGFVEGEERVIRSEVTGRVLDVGFREGASLAAGAVLARLDDRDVAAREAAKRAEVDMLDAQIRRQGEQVTLVGETWVRQRDATAADVRQAEAAAALAERTYAREEELARTGASTRQLLDDQRSARDQSRSALQRAREMLGRAQAEEREIALARHQLDVLREQRAVTAAQLDELVVLRSKFTIHAPAVPTVAQTQLVWPGELAQPGTPVAAVLDPKDTYVQLYVPVADVAAFRLGRKVEVELDSRPGQRLAGEVSFVADQANFTPEKIETRDDRLGQVYRAKITLADAQGLQPGTEGDVYLVGE